MRISALWLLVAVSGFVGCRHTLPGTHVEVVDKGGEKVYHSGAANVGHNRLTACGGAHKRVVAAIALRFAQENDDLADDVADAVGVSDGEVFLQKYAKSEARTIGARDEEFDPIEHVCMVTVTWKAPIFVKEAITEFAEKIKRAELGGSPDAPPAAPAPASTAPAAPAPVSTAPDASPAPATADPCADERAGLKKARQASLAAQDKLDECMRRTSDDETICHRYKLYLEQAESKKSSRDRRLADCLATGG